MYFFAARGTGDPHYSSFDGKRFDFQGPGDFVELELLSADGNVMFQIQSRLYEIPRWKGNTVHLAIALGKPGTLGFEVRKNVDGCMYITCMIHYQKV